MISPERSAAFGAQLVERRRRGRPRRDNPTIKANVKLSIPVYDALCRQAIAERVSLHCLLQRALTRVAESRSDLRRAEA